MPDAPPVGYSIVDGAWNTDALEDTTVYKTGKSSVKFPAIAGGCYLKQTVGTPVATGDLFLVGGWRRAGGTTDHSFLVMHWHDADDGYSASSSITWDTAVAVADTWEYVTAVVQAPAGAYFAHVAFGASGGTTDIIWWDSAYVQTVPASFFAMLTSNQSCATGTTVVFDSDTDTDGPCHDYGGVYNTTTGIFTARRSGSHLFTAGLQVNNLNAGNQAIALFYRNGNFAAYCSQGRAHADGDDLLTTGVYGPVWLVEGETVKVVVSHDYGSARDVYGYGSAPISYFGGAELF